MEQSRAGVVSLAPAITETIYALELDDRLIGRSDFDRIPPEVTGLPSVGTALNPNFEAIARLRPAVILTDASGAAHREALSRLAEVIELPWLTVADVAAGIRAIGQRFGRTAPADELADRFEATLNVQPDPEAPRVLFALEGADANEVWFLRRNSVHGRALEAAGGRNAVDRDVNGPAVLTPEGLLRTDPDVIVVLSMRGSEAEARLRARQRFSGLERLSAVRSGRIGAVVGPRFALPGPSILALVDELAGELAALER